MRVPPKRAFIPLVVAAAIAFGATASLAQTGTGGITGGMRMVPTGTAGGSTISNVGYTPSFSLPQITARWFRLTNSISLTHVVSRPSAHALRERGASR